MSGSVWQGYEPAGDAAARTFRKSFPGRLSYGFLSLLIRLLYRPVYEGLENVPASGACIIAGNHQSFADPILAHIPLPRNAIWLAKKELFPMAFIGWFIRGMQAIPIDRQSVDVKAMKVLMTRLREGEMIGIFPEGTRKREAPKPGVLHMLARMQVPIVPFCIPPLRRWQRNLIRFGQPFLLERHQYDQADETDGLLFMNRIYGVQAEAWPDRLYSAEGGDADPRS